MLKSESIKGLDLKSVPTPSKVMKPYTTERWFFYACQKAFTHWLG